MRTFVTHRLTVLVAALAVACAVGSSSAREFSISHRGIRATWASLEFRAEFGTIRCPVTIEGSFHANGFGKTVGNLIGAVFGANVQQEACVGGRVSAFNGTEPYNGGTAPQTLPGHYTFFAYSGTLPNVTAVYLELSRNRWGVRDSGGFCTGQYGTAEDRLRLGFNREAGGRITSVETVAASNRLTLFRRDGGFLCPPRGEVLGTGQVAAQGTTTRIALTLI